MDSQEMTIHLISTYDLRLVMLSIVVAVVASYTALDLAGRVTAAQGGSRTIWLFGGAASMGIGIWSMHFIGMLAFSLPVPIGYDILITIVSMIAAIIASCIALFVVSRKNMGTVQLISGGVLMGVGIGTMHYTGMAAMQMEAHLSYDMFFFLLSVVIAVAVSLVALWLAFHLRGDSTEAGTVQKVVSALVMGGAIVGLHYTAMQAALFTPMESSAAVQNSGDSGNSWLAVVIGVATFIVLGLALFSSLVNRRGGDVRDGHASPVH